MCYCGCPYESYPYGMHEVCICKLPRGTCCPIDRDCEPASERDIDYKEDTE